MRVRDVSSIEQQRSFDELGTPLNDVTFCVLDLETTGGNRNDDMITEVGVVKVRGGECLGTFQTLVNPGRAIPPQISILTGLTDALVAPAPRIEAVLPSLLSFLGDSVLVAHNAGFDVGFVRAALARAERPAWNGTIVDTVHLARRLVRDEVPNCKLSTLASRLRLDHQPSHRALDDALATTDLLHLLIERASGLGVLGLDDLVALGKIGGHPMAPKLKLTAGLPRTPGVYMFRGHGDAVLYVGKATNLRQRVRSYFGSDDRRKIGPMLRETTSVTHVELPDPLTAEIVETRYIGQLLPRYNRRGTRASKYCYVRLDTETAWPRLSIVKNPGKSGEHIGPLPSRTMATLVVDALQTALPLRRCTQRLGRNYVAPSDAPVCSAAQLGVAHCPCSGTADADDYAAAVALATQAIAGDPSFVVGRLRDRMAKLAGQQRFEEAAMIRDRLSALLGAIRRTLLFDALATAGRAEVTDGVTTWIIAAGALVDTRTPTTLTSALPLGPLANIEPGRPSPREHADEALCLAKFFDKHSHRLSVTCDGAWSFPIASSEHIPPLERAA
ncbi:DEDD exonuclease domain-containing protein [Ilumatobacter nonamiensis]|uniref:DEDD exonuclease domain-containing protein n=1 Tax=Ilumatobacter nonamiensis TaxID=467093 RepID=UPI000686E82D|nr:DEDD exonuclease domain-containing protein [Ilumatobacter nonamiensis]